MDGSSALAKLIGGRSQFLIHRTTVILGRATSAAPSVRAFPFAFPTAVLTVQDGCVHHV